MKCFNHHTNDSFSMCKACGKALCDTCYHQTQNQTSCGNESCNEIISTSKNNSRYAKALLNPKRVAQNIALYFSLFGLAFMGLGVLDEGWHWNFFSGMGTMLIVFGCLFSVIRYVQLKKMQSS